MDKLITIQVPEWLSSTLASDATEGKGVIAGWIRPSKMGSRVIGPAFVALGSHDDNKIIRRVVAEVSPPPGTVLVVGGQSTSRTATVGNLIALEIQNLGFAGLVTDGLVRDSNELQQQKLLVWCRGVTPISSAKRDPGVIGGAISIGGVLVREGDWVIGDDDGIVIWPKENIEELLKKAKERLDLDNDHLTHITSGKKPLT